ncbi:MAG: ABC-type bacteriocin/lantibiotic exporter with double-glycine peptidase domain, partial [Verrucomicrobiales bacterium]
RRMGIGKINNLTTTEIGSFTSAVYQFGGLVSSACFAVLLIFLGALMNWQLMAGVSVFGLVLFPLLRGMSERRRLRSLLFTAENAKMQSLSIESLTYFKYFRATAQFGKLVHRLKQSFGKLRHFAFMNQITSHGLAQLLRLTQLLLILSFFFVTAVIQGQGIAAVLTLALVLYRGFQEMSKVQEGWQLFLNSAGSIEAVEEEIGRLKAIQETEGGETPHFGASMRLEQVTVKYGEIKALDRVSLEVRPREQIAIIGESGAGKSTLVDVICGLIDPDEGAITLDGKAYSELDRRALRSMLGYVTQEPVVLEETLLQNITLWNKDSSEKWRQAAKDAAALEFIEEREGGVNAEAGERGGNLSGGQRQRLAIARELYRNPEIMIFDEATSALDAESSRSVSKAIDQLRGRQTMIIITHKLESLRKCDRIYVIDGGKLVSEGSWSELSEEAHPAFLKLASTSKY